MRASLSRAAAAVALLCAAAGSVAAHHVEGGRMPTGPLDGLLSGLGHPIIGLDHLAAVIAVGCLAAAHRAGAALAIGFVVATAVGAAVHVRDVTLPGSELLVALSLLVLGAATVRRRRIGMPAALILFVVGGLVHGYALAESIVGAEPAPLVAYFAGLVVVQSAIALAAMTVTRMIAARNRVPDPEPVRLLGAVILGIGLAALAQLVVPSV